VLLNWDTQQIIATAFGKGRTHDFRRFKQSCTHVHPNIMVLADLGYLGLDRLHAHTFLPAKATQHHPLSHEEKQANRTLARLRLHIERVIGRLKVFRSLSERYRGRRKRFGLRFNLISGIHNFELSLKS
jgi:transposase